MKRTADKLNQKAIEIAKAIIEAAERGDVMSISSEVHNSMGGGIQATYTIKIG